MLVELSGQVCQDKCMVRAGSERRRVLVLNRLHAEFWTDPQGVESARRPRVHLASSGVVRNREWAHRVIP